MKVLLNVEVKKLGRKGEIVDVSDGYATSALIPSGKAIAATPAAIASAAQNTKKQEADVRQKEEQARARASKLKGQIVKIARKANGDKLFGSIGAKEVAQEIKNQYTEDVIDQNVLVSHIKETGDHVVDLDLGFGVKTQITVRIIAL